MRAVTTTRFENNFMSNNKIAIIGAGITGLTTAYQLQKNGMDISLFEKRSDPGGAVKTVHNNGWQVEYGPNTLLLKDAEIADFLNELNLDTELKEANPEAGKRYILKDSSLEAAPSGIMDAVTTTLFSAKAKLRVLGEPFISKSTDNNETVAEFVTRRLGREFLDYAINPFVAGIFAGSPEQLSMQHAFPQMKEMEEEYGSLIAAAFAGVKKRKKKGRVPRKLISFRNGIQTLPKSIAANLINTFFNHVVKGVSGKPGNWMITTNLGSYGPFREVILNVPAYKINEIDLPAGSHDLRFFDDIVYPPVSVIALGFRRDQLKHPLDGFGFLVPEVEKREILGTLFSSSLFENRAPHNHVLLTTFTGGMRQPRLADLDSEKLFGLVKKELSELLDIDGEPVYREHIYWPKAIPQYLPEYEAVLNKIENLESKLPGIHFAGNYRGGISVPDCIKSGISLSKTIIKN